LHRNLIAVKETVLEKLKTIEHQFDVKILYACESGSRAWGFASPDSDYDVRFIYVHRKDHYLSMDENRDVIELPVNDLLDINGWELRKALRLFRKSNGPLYEWLHSPIMYREMPTFTKELWSLAGNYFSPRAAMHHYLSMAKGVYESELAAEKVKLKKYFYALRPVLAAKWIADFDSVPPMDFNSLRKLLPQDLGTRIDALLARKSEVSEGFLIDSHSGLNSFIKDCIRYCEAKVPPVSAQGENSELNGLFRRYLV
jgi:uncharacterized protein